MTTDEVDIVDAALALILDDERTAAWLDKRAEEILGRASNSPAEDDAEWWDAKTTATNELLVTMRARNSVVG